LILDVVDDELVVDDDILNLNGTRYADEATQVHHYHDRHHHQSLVVSESLEVVHQHWDHHFVD